MAIYRSRITTDNNQEEKIPSDDRFSATNNNTLESENVKDEQLETSEMSKTNRLVRWAFRHQIDEKPIYAFLRSCLRVIIIMVREFQITGIPLRSSALTYSIMLSLVPILAMSTAILKGYGSDNDLRIAAYRLIDKIDPDVNSTPTVADPGAALENDKETKEASLPDHLRSGIDTIFTYVDRTNFATLGAFGIIGLLYAVVLVMSTIESAMNVIWHSEQGRSFSRKIIDYIALIILLPISVNVALAGDAILASPTMFARIHAIIPSAWLITMTLKLLPFLFIVLSLMIMFRFFPNVRVEPYAALSGAIFASIFWFIVQRLYFFAQLGVARYNAIYGSFATVPLFLIWVNLGWMFILLGASLAYAVQNRNRYCLGPGASSPQRQLQLAFDILQSVYENFDVGHKTSLDSLLSAYPTADPGNLKYTAEKLVEGSILHRIGEKEISYTPALPSQSVEARQVVRIFLGNESITTTGGVYSRRVIYAAESAIARDDFPNLTTKLLQDNSNHPTEQPSVEDNPYQSSFNKPLDDPTTSA
ncbi:MAG: YihY/virulence factor BrkB family protein [Desulfobulbaceae bacterium]|nr:YihY/virulence factor BrkB family protein [Desulfobulbaceae bacterium]